MDFTNPVVHTGVVEDALGRSGLARIDMRHDADIARSFERGCARHRSIYLRRSGHSALLERLLTPEARQRCTTRIGEHIVGLKRRAGKRDELDTGLYIDMKSYLSDNILVKVDRMSMACSLEARVPYLDHELVEMAFDVPEELKVSGRQTKVLLKRVAARHIPDECVYRAKQGFSIPIKNWLGNEFRPLMEDLLSRRRLEAEGLFVVAEVERLKAEHLAGRENHSHILWALLVFQDWRRRWCPA